MMIVVEKAKPNKREGPWMEDPLEDRWKGRLKDPAGCY